MTREQLYEQEENIREILGTERLLDELEKAIGTDELAQSLAYIARNYDIPTTLRED